MSAQRDLFAFLLNANQSVNSDTLEQQRRAQSCTMPRNFPTKTNVVFSALFIRAE